MNEQKVEAQRILIIDDEAPVRELLETFLTKHGYEVITASNGNEGFELAREHTIHLTLLDFVLPDCDGFEVLARLKKIKERRPVIMMTGFGSDDSLLETALANGATDCVSKTSPLSELLLKIQKALADLDPKHATKRGAGLSDPRTEGAAAPVPRARILDGALHAFCIKFGLAALGTRHPNLGNNAERAVALAGSVADELNLSEGEQQSLILAAALHDIALLGWDRDLIRRWLRTPARCTQQDWVTIRAHPAAAEDFLSFEPSLRPVAELIGLHHEHWDGGGFPAGLKGRSIPWLGRLLAVIAAFCNRSLISSTTGAELRDSAAKSLDPEAIDVVIAAASKTQFPAGTREFPLDDLHPGMVLREEIRLSDGSLVVAKDFELTAAWINRLQAMHSQTPLKSHVLIGA